MRTECISRFSATEMRRFERGACYANFSVPPEEYTSTHQHSQALKRRLLSHRRRVYFPAQERNTCQGTIPLEFGGNLDSRTEVGTLYMVALALPHLGTVVSHLGGPVSFDLIKHLHGGYTELLRR